MVEFNRVIPDTDIGIYGQGFIGDKADQLVEKTTTLRGMGFHTPERVVMAEGFFDGFFRRNRLGDTLRGVTATPTLARSIRGGSFSMEDFNALQVLVASFGDTPLVVRSSAAGDARGTGIYQTEFSENRPDLVSKALQKVLASYFSESAIAFRRDAQTGEGFGIMIEPLIGQKIADDFDTYVFAPKIPYKTIAERSEANRKRLQIPYWYALVNYVGSYYRENQGEFQRFVFA